LKRPFEKKDVFDFFIGFWCEGCGKLRGSVVGFWFLEGAGA
jgi:hypothetical protein